MAATAADADALTGGGFRDADGSRSAGTPILIIETGAKPAVKGAITSPDQKGRKPNDA